MMIQVLVLTALGLAVPARADISDSGNLTIGGQGIIQGTMTVQGNAFSVGGSTFSVLVGTVNVGGLLKVSAAGIQWNDDTVSTTSSSGTGAGNVVLTATQTFSGANTFTGGVAFLGETNACYRISFSSFSAVSSVVLSNVVVASTNYMVDFAGTQNTANGNWYVRFNGDTGANYKSATIYSFPNGNTYTYGQNGVPSIVLASSTNAPKAGHPVSGRFNFRTAWGNPKYTRIYNSSIEYHEGSISLEAIQMGGGWYQGSANLSSITLGTDAGTMTGYAEVWNCGAWKIQN